MTSNTSRLSGWLALAFSVLSAVTSGIGLWWIIDQNTQDLRLSIGLAIATTTLIQVSILYAWSQAASPGWSRKMRFVAMMFGLAFSLMSGLFAAGSYIALFNRNEVQTLANEERLGIVVEPLARASNQWLDLARDLEALSDEVRHKAETESRVGGSCDGDTPQIGDGPRYRLRQRHANQADDMAQTVRGLSAEASDILRAAQGDYSRESMLHAFDAARDLASHRDFARVAAWLRSESAGFGSQFVDPESNDSFVCRDADLQTRMMAALEMIAGGFELPLLPPEPVEITVKDTIGKSYADAFALVFMVFLGDFDPIRFQAASLSLVGYLAAGVVEAAIIYLLLAGAAGRRARGGHTLSLDVWNGTRRKLPAILRQDYAHWVPLILKLTLEDRNQLYFARPVDGAPDVVAICLEIYLRLNLPCDPDFRPAIPLSEVVPEWVEARSDVHGGARHFALHPLEKDRLEWLKLAARDLDQAINMEPC